MPMNRKAAIHQLTSLRDRLKQGALHSGHYPTPHTAAIFDARDKSAAFPSIAYRRAVRDINAVDLAIGALKEWGL